MDSDHLYGLPLDRFIAERGALVKSLRKAGRRDAAAEVAALRKPSVAAWAVNQLMRTQHAAVTALFGAGDELRKAQEDLLAGSADGRALRAAGERERTAVDELVDAAGGLLTAGGDDLSATVVERVADTLHAAALDEDAREQVRQGRLERELRHVGLGLGTGAAPPRPPRAKATPAPERRASGGRRADDGEADAPRGGQGGGSAGGGAGEQQRAAAERDRRERAAARSAARAAEAAARRRATSATRALEAAEAQRDQAAATLAEAAAGLAAARAAAAIATAALEQAEADLERTRRGD